MGYLTIASEILYVDFGPTFANITVGILSAIVDNIPIMFAVLTMLPEMSEGQWLLVTLTAGVGGSLLSIGSAAGVAVMGQARGKYTFTGHLKWSWAIALGYAASILVHLIVYSVWLPVVSESLPGHSERVHCRAAGFALRALFWVAHLLYPQLSVTIPHNLPSRNAILQVCYCGARNS